MTLIAQESQSTAPSSAAAAAAERTGALSLDECIARAMRKNFDLKIETFNVQNAGEALTIADAEFTPSFQLSTTRSKSQSYASGTDSDTFDTRAGVTQKIVSGATVSVSTSLDRSSNSAASPASLNPAYNADLSLSVNQPLLKDFGTTANKAAINRAKISVTRAGLDYKGNVLAVISLVENAYYNLCYAREQLSVRKSSHELAQTLLDEAKTRKDIGVATDLDILQAEVGVANAYRSIILAEQTVSDRQDDLLSLIGQFELDSQVGEVSFPAYEGSAPSYERSYKLARENQPNFLSSEAYLKQLEIDVAAAKKSRLPSLDLDAAVGYNTVEGSAGRSLREIPGSDGYSWQLGLSLRMPWGLKAENARYRSTLNNLSQGRTRQQQVEQNLMLDVRSAVRSVVTNTKSVEISAQATALSREKYRIEREKFTAGKSTPRLVLEAKDDMENALINELQAKVSLRSAISALHRLEGSSIDQYKINTQ